MKNTQTIFGLLVLFGISALSYYNIQSMSAGLALGGLIVMVESFRGALILAQSALRQKNKRAGDIGFGASVAFTCAIAVASWIGSDDLDAAITFQIANAMMLAMEFIFSRLIEPEREEMMPMSEYDALAEEYDTKLERLEEAIHVATREKQEETKKAKEEAKEIGAELTATKSERDKLRTELDEARTIAQQNEKEASRAKVLAHDLKVMRAKFEDAHEATRGLREKEKDNAQTIADFGAKIEELAPFARVAEEYRAVIERVGKVSRHKGALQVLCKCGDWHSKKTDRIECDCGQVYTREDVKATQ